MARKPRPGSIRNVVSGRSDGYTGRVPFARLGITVAYESLLMRDFLIQTAAFESDVTAITSEPARVELPDGDWISDYRIERTDGTVEEIEVKPIEIVDPRRAPFFDGDEDALEAACEEAAARFRSMAAATEAQGRVFRLVTEDEIRVQPRLDNAALILRHSGPLFPQDWILEARKVLATHTIADIPTLQAAMPSRDALVIALRLQWSGDVAIDPTRPFSRDSSFVRADASLLPPT